MSDPRALADAEMKRVSAIRMALVESHPFWGYLLMQCRIVPSPGLKAIAATDSRRTIYLNPEKSSALGIRQLGFVLLHEVCHHIQASFSRQQGRDRFLWNCASDLAINRIIAQIPDPSGISRHLYTPPEGVLLDSSFDDMVAEAIYESILKDPRFRERRAVEVRVSIRLPDPNQGDAGGGGGGAPGAGRGTGKKRGAESTPGTLGGQREIMVEDHGGGIDIHLPGDLTDAEREGLEDMIRAALGHWMASNRRGDMPGFIGRAFLTQKPKVHWRQVLRNHLVAFLGREEFTRSKPNRRWLSAGVIVPGFQDEKVGRVVVALDTSGSMDEATLGEVISELGPLVDQVEDLDLIVADAKVHEVIALAELPGWLARGKAKGGGGTSHVPVFDWIRNNGPQPDLFIGLTDLFTTLPDKRPGFPVIWICPENHGAAPWGRVVEVAR
jgi:predicted metal-dependent peptidase